MAADDRWKIEGPVVGVVAVLAVLIFGAVMVREPAMIRDVLPYFAVVVVLAMVLGTSTRGRLKVAGRLPKWLRVT